MPALFFFLPVVFRVSEAQSEANWTLRSALNILQLEEDLLEGIVAAHFLHGTGHDELAALYDGHHIAELFRDLKHVGGEEDGSASVAVLAHEGLELVRGDGVEADEGFVHDDELRLVDEGGDEGELLLHAVGIGGDGLGEVVGELELVGVTVYALVADRKSVV